MAEASARMILRSFDTPVLSKYAKLLDGIAAQLRPSYPQAKIELTFRRTVSQHGRRAETRTAGRRQGGPGDRTGRTHSQAVDYPRRNGRFAADCSRIDPEPLDRRTQPALTSRMDLPGRNGVCGKVLIELAREWGTEQA